jgi:hypothetical protein
MNKNQFFLRTEEMKSAERQKQTEALNIKTIISCDGEVGLKGSKLCSTGFVRQLQKNF